MRARSTRLNLVLVGFGSVARAFVGLLEDRRDRLARDYALDPCIVGIATRRHGCAFDPSGLDAHRAVALVEAGQAVATLDRSGPRPLHDTFDLLDRVKRTRWRRPVVVLETTTLNVRGGEPAVSHVKAAFAAGAHVITANKGPVACAWPELSRAAARARRHLLFEGVVMDGIPVFNLVRDTLPALVLTHLRGIVNATTNYVIAALEEGRELAPALAEMQARGIAEADASLDVDGWDAAAKAAALANVLMDARLTPAEVRRTGIGHLTPADAKAALDAGCRLKLVMRVERSAEGVTASVAPERLPLDDPLARIHGTMNAITIGTDRLGEITVTQHGGSLVGTAYALLSDLVALARRF